MFSDVCTPSTASHNIPGYSNPKITVGKSVIVSCLVNKLHLRRLINGKYAHQLKNQRLEGALVLRQEVKRVGGKEHKCVKLTHEDCM